MNILKCKFVGIISSCAAYIVYDEDDNIIGYSDRIGFIDYDKNCRYNPYIGEIDIISVDESAWD